MRILLASISVGLAIGCASAPQQPPVPLPPVETTASTTPEAVLQRLFTSERIESGWFAEEFLGQVPFPRVVALVTDLRGALGDWRGVRRVGAVYDVQLASGAVPVRISIDPAGRISALWAASPRPSAALIPAVLARFNELPARARSVLLLEGETERAALNPDLPLAVATSSRLAVIVALREAVTAGTHSWSEVVPLRPAWQSLPTGILQTWPPDAPLTVYTLAALAAAHSDNTAFDALIDLVGRTAVEGFAPHNRPFLTTREVFALKDPLNGALLAQFWAGDEPQRRALLPDLDARALPSPEAVMGVAPVSPAAEWTFTTRELCALMRRAADLPFMSINPGLISPEGWDRVSFVGATDLGVVNMTTLLESHGRSYCASLTWNGHTALDNTRLGVLYNQMVAALR